MEPIEGGSWLIRFLRAMAEWKGKVFVIVFLSSNIVYELEKFSCKSGNLAVEFDWYSYTYL